MTQSSSILSNIPLSQSSVAHTVFIDDAGYLKTTSRFVAEVFGKHHKDVIRAIERLDCSDEFNERNFAPVEYIDAKGEARPMYEMTFDGFTFLVMGFTGKSAAQFKEAYIAEFNRLREKQAKITAERISYLEKYAVLPKLPLTQDIADEIVTLLAQRMPIADIARLCRVSQNTVRLVRDSARDLPLFSGKLED